MTSKEIDDDHADDSPPATTASPTGTATGRSDKEASRKRPRPKVRMEGTTAGDGVLRLCYCPRHRPVTREEAQHAKHAQHAQQPAHHGHIQLPPPPARFIGSASFSNSPVGGLTQIHGCHIAAGDTAQQASLPQHTAGCARGLPYNHALRRGHREPDAIAAAAAKRLFVRQTPYFTTIARDPRAPQPACRAYSPEEWAVRRGRGFCREPVSPAVQSRGERYTAMCSTLSDRVTCGKSAIHGFGAFSKQPHSAGDMVIEYVGEVRNALRCR